MRAPAACPGSLPEGEHEARMLARRRALRAEAGLLVVRADPVADAPAVVLADGGAVVLGGRPVPDDDRGGARGLELREHRGLVRLREVAGQVQHVADRVATSR